MKEIKGRELLLFIMLVIIDNAIYPLQWSEPYQKDVIVES